MFVLSVDRRQNVLLVEFSGTMTDVDFEGAEAGILAFIAREGPARRIMDLTAVEVWDVPDALMVQRAKTRPLTSSLARVVVAPTDYLFAICRMFTSYQATQDIEHPPIVRSRTLAYAELGLSDPDFRPV